MEMRTLQQILQKAIIREYFEKLYSSKLENLEEKDKVAHQNCAKKTQST
jgi:hypothetical protein